MYDKIEDDAWLCPGYDELKKGKMYHSTMLTHRKGAHMQLTWHAKSVYTSIHGRIWSKNETRGTSAIYLTV